MPEFEAQLRQLDFALQRKGLIDAAKAGAQILVDAASAAAPRDSGALADGIQMRVSSKESDIHEATVDVGPDKRQFYARFIERGTKKMRAHPFLGPAFEANIERISEAIHNKMRELILTVTK